MQPFATNAVPTMAYVPHQTTAFVPGAPMAQRAGMVGDHCVCSSLVLSIINKNKNKNQR